MEQQKQKWWEMQWPRRHALAFPFGATAATALLTYLTTGGQGTLAANLKVAAEMVDLAALIYGMVAVTIEGGVRLMFWAWEKHKAVREALREEGREAGRQEGRLEGRQEGSKAGRKAERAAMQAHLEKVSKETGIPLTRLLPPSQEE